MLAGWLRFCALPVACAPCCVLACLGRVVTCHLGGGALTSGCEGCVVAACQVLDEEEPENYEWIAQASKNDRFVAKEVLASWVVVARAYLERNQDDVQAEALGALARRIKCIADPMQNVDVTLSLNRFMVRSTLQPSQANRAAFKALCSEVEAALLG